jgi:tyrosinase
MWTSKPIVPSSTTFHYTYPEFVGFETATPAKLADHVLQQVHKLYGDPMRNLVAAVPALAPAAPAPAPDPVELIPPPAHIVTTPASAIPASDVVLPPPAQQQPLGKESESAPAHPPATAPANKPTAVSGTKWTARVRCNHHDIQGSFSILLFVGDVPEDPKKWRRAPTYAGSNDIFLMGAEAKQHCANCRGSDAPAPAPLISYVEGYIHLNDALKRAKLPSLESDVVAPYLQKNLHWRVKKASLFSLLTFSLLIN